jgi:hypothetical protein
MNIVSPVAVGAHHSCCEMYVQAIPLSIKPKGQPLAAVTGETCIDIPGLARGENELCLFFLRMALIATSYMTFLTIELVVRDFGYLHKTPLFLVPETHSCTSEVEAF